MDYSSSPAQKPFNLRLPRLGDKTEDLLRILYVNSESKSDEELRAGNLFSQARYGEYLIHAQDPAWENAIHRWYGEMLGFVAGADLATTPVFHLDTEKSPDLKRFALMMLWMHCLHLPNEYVRVTVVDTMPSLAGVSYEQLFLLDKPDSDIWNDDQRLVLKWVDALFNFRMTDELFAAAVDSWGAKTILHCVGLLMYYYMMTLLFEATGLDRWSGLRPDKSFFDQTGWPEAMRGGRPPESRA